MQRVNLCMSLLAYRRLKVSYCDLSSSIVCPFVHLSVNFFFKQHLLLNHWSKFKITSHEGSHNALYQNCIICSAPPHRRAARAPDEKPLKSHLLLNHWSNFKNNFTELFLLVPSTIIAQMVPLHWTKGLPELQIRKIFKRPLYWSKL